MADPIDIVTLDQAKRRLRILHADEDASIEEMITEASAAILDYIKAADDATWTSVQMLCLKTGTLNMVQWLYNGSPKSSDEDIGQADGYLPKSVTMFLHRLRDPALA